MCIRMTILPSGATIILHPPMSLSDRAAQFSPFSALTGYDKALGETAELARERVEEEVVKVREDGELILKREYE